MKPETLADQLQRLLSEVAFTRAYGFRVSALGDGECTLDVPFQPELERPGGVVSGPVFMAAADVSVWLAIMTRLGAADRSVTTELTSVFLRPVVRESFRCRARILKLGRRLIYAVAECSSTRGEIVTHHTVTYARGEPPGVGPVVRDVSAS
jgi:uncharacterized protein (TIGR00369 family)